MELEPESLAVADGVKELLKKLDQLFSEDINQTAFNAYECFEQYKCENDLSMKDYINKFERMYNKIKHMACCYHMVF